MNALNVFGSFLLNNLNKKATGLFFKPVKMFTRIQEAKFQLMH